MDKENELFELRSYVADSDGANFDSSRLFVVHRRDMSFVSEYFRRDSRRYDNGFEMF